MFLEYVYTLRYMTTKRHTAFGHNITKCRSIFLHFSAGRFPRILKSVLELSDGILTEYLGWNNVFFCVSLQVVVNCPSAGCEQKFRCGKWLALDEGDGLIERTLYETSRKMREKSTPIFRLNFFI